MRRGISGKGVIVLMVAVALALGVYAWWHQRQTGRRSAQFWGTRGGLCVRYAPDVEFVPLQPVSEESSGLRQRICGQDYILGDPVSISRSRGLVHARHALVTDLSFDWEAGAAPPDAQWEFLLRFRDSDEQVTAAFDPGRRLVCFVEAERTGQLVPRIADAFAQKKKEWEK